jgi:hypothetical protein
MQVVPDQYRDSNPFNVSDQDALRQFELLLNNEKLRGNPRNRYADGGMSPDQAAMMAQQQEQQQAPPQQGGGIDPQQVMQIVAQKLQQGEEPQQIMQELIQAGVPQDQAQQIIQQVMQQLQQSQGQQAAEQTMEEGAPQGMSEMGMAYGGSTNKRTNFEVGGEYNVTNNDIKKLIAQGYKIEYI